MEQVFERFVKESPVSVIMRAAMEHALAPDALDALFARCAERQYARELLFSSVVDTMGLVVCKIHPSINAAYQKVAETLPVSLTSLYNKINGLEPAVVGALVNHTAGRLGSVIDAMGGRMPAMLPGYRVRILDGNHLAATERRLGVLRGCWAGPLPGHALVVLDPALMLATDMIPCEDGHAQERSLSPAILDLVAADDVWICDRNFCTIMLLTGMGDRGAFFAIRHHANMTLISQGTERHRGRTDTGDVYEQAVTITESGLARMKVRRITIRLDRPTRDADAEISILTNLPDTVNAVAIAELYRKRWTLETMFQSLALILQGELATMGHPRAALLGFGVALSTYNILSTVQAAMRSTFGVEKVETEVSGYYIADEVRSTSVGMSIAVDSVVWEKFQTMPSVALAKELLRYAIYIRLPRFKRHPRGPKKPVPKRTKYINTPHVSTAQLLAEEKRRKSP